MLETFTLEAVIGSTFQNNQALNGSGAFIQFEDEASDITVSVTSTKFARYRPLSPMSSAHTLRNGMAAHSVGGALHLLAKGSLTKGSYVVDDCTFDTNVAEFGAAVLIYHTGAVTDSTVSIASATVLGQLSSVGSALVFYSDQAENVQHFVMESLFTNGGAAYGAGFQIIHSKTATNSQTEVTASHFSSNIGEVGAGVNVWFFDGLIESSVIVSNSQFSENQANFCGGAMAVLSPKRMKESTIAFKNVTFDGNTAQIGGGLCLTLANAENSRILLEGSSFSKNQAQSYGGGLAVTSTVASANVSTDQASDVLYSWKNTSIDATEVVMNILLVADTPECRYTSLATTQATAVHSMSIPSSSRSA